MLRKGLIVFFIFAILGNLLIINREKTWENFYKNDEKIVINCVVISDNIDKNYYIEYEVKIIDGQYNGKKLILKIKKEKENKNLKYGQKINITGTYKEPEIQRNPGGFDYQKYLKSQDLYGSIVVKNNNIKIKKERHINFFSHKIHDLKLSIEDKLKKYLTDKNSSLIIGLILGDKKYLSEETKENFTNSSLAHLLVVSGAHISYLIVGITLILNKLKLSKRLAYIISIIFLFLFLTMVGYSPSIVRATIMGVLILLSKLLYKKADTYTSIGIALIIILFQNPYSLWDIGMQLSFLSTLGIIIFYPIIISFLNRKTKKFKLIKETISISISAQILILPILVCTFHTFSIHFLISNILATPLFAFAVIYGAVVIAISSIIEPFTNILFGILSIDLNLLNYLTEIIGKSKWGSLIIARMNIYIWIFYYAFFIFLCWLYRVVSRKEIWEYLNKIEKIELKIVKIIDEKKNMLLKYTCLIFLIIIATSCFFIIIPSNLEINFIDVGQGDSMLICTSYHKTILIDGGGSLDKDSYDVGEKTLVPYLLNKNIKKLDYIIVSHFDSDHVGGLLTVMEKLQVENAIISKQIEKSENYDEFKKIAREKRIKIIVVEKGDLIKIDNDTKIQILWPKEEQIRENALNNNSIVAKLTYKKFSILLTGDIEEIAERQIISEYREKNILNATILKVAHHGSKTSSTKSFLEAVKPKISLIGVGKNNLFGHPNGEVIERLEKIGAKVYRTDEMGEISITVNKKGGIKVKRFIE